MEKVIIGMQYWTLDASEVTHYKHGLTAINQHCLKVPSHT